MNTIKLTREGYLGLLGLTLLALGVIWLSKCTGYGKSEEKLSEPGLPDTLRVVTLSGSTIYFQYKDEEMGYQYDLLKAYAENSGLPFVLTTAPDLDSIHRLISRGEAHLSITPEPVTQSGRQLYRYTGPETLEHIVLVQRKPGTGHTPYIGDVTELIGRRVYLLSGSPYERRLHNLEAQFGGQIDIHPIEDDSLDTEDLIGLVATDSIDYTVASSELARLARTYYPSLDISLEIGFTQRMRWITPLEQATLASDIDRWASDLPSQSKARGIYRRYFEQYKYPTDTELHGSKHPEYALRRDGSLSPYDALFKAEAPRLGHPWELLASIAYQESNFQANVIGWSGARGLMGIMPRTGRAYGADVNALLDPAVSVRVSVDCLLATQRSFKSIADPEQRLKFALAGYNAGIAHIFDAQALARKYGHDPEIWDGHVERYILLKSERRYYTDPVCRYGYLRGRETYNYVREVMHRYERYLALTP